MTIARSRTFRSGNSEALRLPKDVAFGDDIELVLIRSGDVMTIYPAASTIPEILARLKARRRRWRLKRAIPTSCLSDTGSPIESCSIA